MKTFRRKVIGNDVYIEEDALLTAQKLISELKGQVTAKDQEIDRLWKKLSEPNRSSSLQ